MQIVEMRIGNTVMRGHDDCFVKTEKECQDILDNIGRIAAGIYQEKAKKAQEGDTA